MIYQPFFSTFDWHFPFFLMLLALALDQMLGDPVYRFHPVRMIGALLQFLERRLRRFGLDGHGGGVILVFLLSVIVMGSYQGIFLLLKQEYWFLGWVWELFIVYSMVALKDLKAHGQRVVVAAKKGRLEQARRQTGKMVGRDTDRMDFAACKRAVIESFSENLSDAVIAPLLFLLLFGVPGMVFYKTINTLDSMVGYRHGKYQHFGRFAARLDDLLNWIPARLTWLLISGTALFCPGCSARKAFHIGWSQRHFLPSPNAGWPQAAAAGSLQLKLVGPLWRKGQLAHNHWIGDPRDREGATTEDIEQMSKIVNGSTILFGIGYFLLLTLHQLWVA